MENVFNTHGGYFAPEGYLRINEGGSHDENPNGGVQLGVDQNGVPNMLEENEPVYNDFVFSDNITISEDMCAKHNLPKKLAGKLYSEGADYFVDEAEENPLDHISNNGLNAMLGRLADAQEEQKSDDELNETLANMTPEELAELEAMLAEGEEPEDVGADENMLAAPQQFAEGGFVDDNEARARAMMLQAQAIKNAATAEVNQKQLALEQAASQRTALQNAEGRVRRRSRQVQRAEKAAARLEKGAQNIYPADKAAYEQTLLKQYNLIDYNKQRLANAEAELDSLKKGFVPMFDDNPNSFVAAPAAVEQAPTETSSTKPRSGKAIALEFAKGGELPTGLRFAGPVGHTVLAAHNIFTPPTEFVAQRAHPYYPTGTLTQRYATYNPFDYNLVSNGVLSQGAGTTNALTNSGLGPSTGAALVAANYGTTQGLGTGFLQGWQGNAQHRNEVLGLNNTADEKMADFAFRRDAARATALASAEQQNIANNLMVQRLNDAAESEQFGAIGRELGYTLQGLSDIGRENMSSNMVNGVSMYMRDPKTGKTVFNPDFLVEFEKEIKKQQENE